jgi:hypothetical protein
MIVFEILRVGKLGRHAGIRLELNGRVRRRLSANVPGRTLGPRADALRLGAPSPGTSHPQPLWPIAIRLEAGTRAPHSLLIPGSS